MGIVIVATMMRLEMCRAMDIEEEEKQRQPDLYYMRSDILLCRYLWAR